MLFDACASEPIFDYHCHLVPKEIAENKRFDNLANLWLGTGGCGDHYKWRMMRACGIDEKFITGDAPPYERFLKWAETIENLIGNPLYHWTHLELQRYFDIAEPLTRASAPVIWEKANALLSDGTVTVKNIFNKFNIYAVGTTDDPADTLEYHKAIASGLAPIGKIATKVMPSFRPDNALHITKPSFASYIGRLAQSAKTDIRSVDDVIEALIKRLDFFVSCGCLCADHGLPYVPFNVQSDKKIQVTFEAALGGQAIDDSDAAAYMTKVLASLAEAYAKRNIAMQLHVNVCRNLNSRAFAASGADSGYDAVCDYGVAGKLAKFLDFAETRAGLPKTILYSLNPKDYYPFATIMGCFQKAPVRGKMQLGSAWWFCDHKDGMEYQLSVLASIGMLSAFVGMLTDSRSFLSYPRHEYFRRILCNLIGTWVEDGEYPDNKDDIVRIVKDISFGNALRYFSDGK